MNEVKEITVILKGEDKTYKEKFLIYDEIVLTQNDKVIQNCIDQAKSNFKGPHEEVSLKISMEL